LPLARRFPGVRELFAALKIRNLMVSIATSCKSDELRAYDKRLQVLQSVDAGACGDAVRKGKPHPDLYYAVPSKLGLNEPGRALAVGDSPYDAMAAQALGMQAARVLTGGFTAEGLAEDGGDVILRDLSTRWNLRKPRRLMPLPVRQRSAARP
jgi:phosphoglycolate phosphatase-like HAD superfamily hydrolase